MPEQTGLSEATFYILLSLMPGPSHGYGILKNIKTLSNGSLHLSTSTLYTALARLLEQGLIDRLDNLKGQETKRPRKLYQLNGAGKAALETEEWRIRQMLTAVNRLRGEAEP
jgi:DNA-binding PadR family transcriptional regulator